MDGPVRVRRFPVLPPDPARSAALLRDLALRPGDAAREAAWARAQGPVAPNLLAALARGGADDAVVCWTYLYATTQLTLALVRDRSVLVPLAHDEPTLRLGLSRGVTRMAAGLAFMTPEERDLVDDLHGIGARPSAVVGVGIEPGPPGDPVRARARRPLPQRFACYVGRVDAAKGVDGLVRAHAAYRAAGGGLGLVLVGRATGRLRLPAWAVTTGWVEEAERADLVAAAEVVVLPSAYESLSLSALEAWRAGRPTLATARSAVLAGQTARSGGGLLYAGPGTYARQLARLAADREERERLGRAGAAWAATQTWPAATARWRDLLARVRGRGAGAPQAGAASGSSLKR
jgi:glycosyltransferase involved in cell wall biosynthesis